MLNLGFFALKIGCFLGGGCDHTWQFIANFSFESAWFALENVFCWLK